ncbi:unnamed protein product [Schistosoma margrebowiei]|uniref:Uncharacterized protein n=1 Tax=Schistosoma margrebowiei TaxID=48269 RepID=A0A183M7Y3_9TREM|nr:unnamed protein product [Schistosoma margrebowiei]
MQTVLVHILQEVLLNSVDQHHLGQLAKDKVL